MEKKHQAEALSEEQLQDVAGGSLLGNSADCWFEAHTPYAYSTKNNKVVAKCKSRCRDGLISCSCRGDNTRCVDNWHVVENLVGEIWVPFSRDERNHTGDRKAMYGLKV